MNAERFLTEPHYFRQAFKDTMVRIKDTPVIIGDTRGWSAELYYPLNGKKSFINDIREMSLNIEPVQLGYVNYKQKAVYVKRTPSRRWKQGLSTRSINGHMSTQVFYSKSFANTVVNRFPSLEDCIKLLKEDKKLSCAFHRKWALQVGVVAPTLCYKGKRVGICKEGECLLEERFKYLEESLKEALNG